MYAFFYKWNVEFDVDTSLEGEASMHPVTISFLGLSKQYVPFVKDIAVELGKVIQLDTAKSRLYHGHNTIKMLVKSYEELPAQL